MSVQASYTVTVKFAFKNEIISMGDSRLVIHFNKSYSLFYYAYDYSVLLQMSKGPQRVRMSTTFCLQCQMHLSKYV